MIHRDSKEYEKRIKEEYCIMTTPKGEGPGRGSSGREGME